MKFEKSLHIWTSLTLLTGAAALLVSDSVHPGVVGACFLGVVASLVFPANIGPKSQTLLFSSFLVFFVVDVLHISGYVTASTRLMLFVGLLKVWAGRSDRDYLLVLSSSFTLVLVAASGSVSPAFLAVLVAFVFFSILSFLHFETRRAYIDHPRAPFPLSGYVGVSAVVTILIALVATPIFVSVPRSRLGLWSVRGGAGFLVSGFSDHVTLGDIGRILSSRQIFMRIRLSRPLDQIPPDLKWRGVVLNHYDGRSWSSTPRAPRRISRSPARQGFLVSRSRRSNEEILTQIITQESPNRTIFGADQLVWVAGLGEGEKSIRADHNGSLFFSRTRPRSFSYRVDSDLIDRTEKLSRGGSDSLPPDVRQRYLQLPRIDPRIVELTRRITSPRPDAISRALALERFLKENYSYSLENASAASPDPLAHFLLEGGSGHCEYYATALAIMLRIEGIPSRVINGFRRGALNVWSEDLIVRQSDAHSWVEARLPGAGWIELDATPAQAGYDDGIFFLATQMGDALELFWNQLVSFDRISQLSLIVAGLQEVRSGVESLGQLVGSLRLWGATILVRLYSRQLESWGLLLGFLLLAFLIRPALRRTRQRLRRLQRGGVSGVSGEARAYHRQLERVLRKRGLARLTAETPLEFAERAGFTLNSRVPVEITSLYYQARFGGYRLKVSDFQRIEAGLALLR